MATIKTFVGVRLTRSVSSRAIKLMRRMEATGADYNWLEPENMHITLSFFGEVPDVEVPGLCKEIADAASKNEFASQGPFEILVERAGCFPNALTPRVIWMGIGRGYEKLMSLHESIADITYMRGIPKDRHDYNPHLTLGRLRKGGRWNPELLTIIERSSEYICGDCLIEDVVVFSSHFESGRPTYTAMSTIEL